MNSDSLMFLFIGCWLLVKAYFANNQPPIANNLLISRAPGGGTGMNMFRISLYNRIRLLPIFASPFRVVLAAAFFLSGCASSTFRFADAPPVWEIQDRRPIPMPKSTQYIRMDYYYKVLVRRPAVKVLDCAPVGRSKDVNSYDHVPASSWYTPRLGYQEISPEALLRASTVVGPPKPPVRVVRAKHLGSNPGFIIADSRDRLYLIKFDPPENPGVETTTALIVNRLFWGFGFNVPEDHPFYFTSNEVPVDPTANDIDDEQVKLVFSSVAPPQDGRYRATASLLLDGIYLGPLNDTGVRRDDPNDRFPHEDRRVLRALKVFGAFTNQTDIRIDNSLDVYIGQDGEGYVEHYLLDFGEAFGGHGAKHDRLWDGYTHIFSFGEMFGNLPTFGLRIHPWEHIRPTPWKSVAAFEAQYFDPVSWKETYPFEPIQRAREDDNYWAAKIIAAIERAHLEKLVDAANYPEPGAGEYIVETLLQRRQKIINSYFERVSPLEYIGLAGDHLTLSDYGEIYLDPLPRQTRYEVRFYDEGSREIAEPIWIDDDSAGPEFVIPLSADLLRKANDYLRLEVRVWRAEKPAPRPAAFHLRADSGTSPRIVGIVH